MVHRYALRLLVLPALVVQASCATRAGAARPAVPPTAPTLGRIGLAVGAGEPTYTFETRVEGKGEGAASGALGGAGVCLRMAEGDTSGLGVALALLCVPVGLIAGGIHGGVVTAPEQSLDAARKRAQLGIEALHLNGHVTQASLDYAARVGLDIQALERASGPTGPGDLPDYARLADAVDSVIELNVQRIEATSSGRKGVPLAFSVRVQVRVVDVRSGRVLDDYQLSRYTDPRAAEEWLAADGSVLRTDLQSRVRELAIQVLDDVMLYRPVNPVRAQHTARERVPGYALAVVDPPLRTRLPGLHPFEKMRCGADYVGGVTYGWLERSPLGSLQPTFRWEALPRDFDRVPGDGPGQVQDVRYDLRIFDANGVIYERFGLTESVHTLEMTLPSCAELRWTVRARFLLDGNRRATEWTGAYNTIGGYVDPMWIRGRPGKPGLALIPGNLLPFFPIVKTPSADGMACKCL